MPELTPLDDNRQEHFLNGEDLEPITRREHFYAGRESELPAGHQEPETREEWFIQKYRGGGGDVTVVPLSVTENGTYSEEGKAYSPVSVNVPLPQNAYLLKSVANLPAPIASFNDGEDMVMPTLKVAIEPQQEGSGEPSPTNVRPISGWSSVNVVNMSDATNISYFQGLLNGTYGFVDLGSEIWNKESNFFRCSPNNMPMIDGTNCIISRDYVLGNPYASPNDDIYLVYNQNDVGHIIIRDLDYTDATAFKTAMNGAYIIYKLATPTTPTITAEQMNMLLTAFNINGNTYTIDLDGTRYGGEVDVVNGGEQSNKYVKTTIYDAWSVAGNGVFYIDGKATDGKVGALNTKADVLCSIYPKGSCVGATSGAIQNPKTLCIQDLNGIRFMVYDTSFESLADFNAYVAQNGIEIRYELATPTTYDTQPTAVKSLRGVNNVYANTGDIKDAEYLSKEV